MVRGLTYTVLVGALLLTGACRRSESRPHAPRDQTFAELRTVKGALRVTPPEESARAPYPRERLLDGEAIDLPDGALAWMRRDGGATWLIAGPAALVLRADSLEISRGRAFVDSELGAPVELETPRGKLELSDGRASVDVKSDGVVSAYVLRGSARAGNAERARAGEMLTLKGDSVQRAPVTSWEDWTGGLATADPAAEPAPFGIGTVGARQPGDQGKPRFSLVVQRLDVKVTIDRDFALTEVDQTFVNPSSDTVEGLFSFRTPPGAVLQRFGVDRDGDLVWGRVKESKSAERQYQSNVYQGSEEDPALLIWAGAGVYNARLYPIKPGATRRVVTRYAEWLPRQGPNGERRLYVYPMAAEGARGSLPHIEELNVTLDLGASTTASVRSGMGGKREGNRVVVKAFDFVPRADLAFELFDAGESSPVAYRAPHHLEKEDTPEGASAEFASQVAREEPDYLAIPLRVFGGAAEASGGLDLAVVVDTSAATEPGALAIARSMASSLLAHLGPGDRAALWAGDATLRPVADGSGELRALDQTQRKTWLAGLAAVERGGATDLGSLLTEAASKLDPARRGAVVYIGDGKPSVGEFLPKALHDRLARLPATARILAAAVGSEPNVPLLESLVRGAPVEPVADAYGAARAALRLLEAAGRPVWLGASIDLGPGVERLLPRELPPIATDESVLVVGRITGKLPTQITLRGSGGSLERRLSVRALNDYGDLRRRWGLARLNEQIGEGAGRSALVETARRFGLVSPFTSLYVATKREVEAAPETLEDLASEREHRRARWKPWWHEGTAFGRVDTDALSLAKEAAPAPMELSPATASAPATNKEGGTGTRAKGEEGAMGNPGSAGSDRRYAVQGPKDAPEPSTERQDALNQAREFGMIGVLGGDGKPAAEPAAPPPPADVEPAKPAAAASAAPLATAAIDEAKVDDEKAPLALRLGSGGGGLAAVAGASIRPRPAAHAHGSTPPAVAKPASAAIPAPVPVPAPVSVPASRQIGSIGHEPRPCGAAADLALSERLVLWRERLATVTTVALALDVYRHALRDCEASRWDERALLLVYMVDRLRTVQDRVALWRSLLTVSPAAADAVYRFLLVRVQTAADLKAFHDALGFKHIEPTLLASLLKQAKSPAERLSLLRGVAGQWPDDSELALVVLDAFEDAGDDAGGRAWARRLRHRVDATSHVRTNVGEYYLRLSQRETGNAASNDSEEARRTFGEIVEFASEDPLARRLLGDLLRAHGWYEEAFRQYQTLADLTPDDASVPLLLASAAQGMGRVEEAVRWTEKAAGTGSPDGASGVALAARASASAFLAWARDEATRAGRSDEADRLRTRAARLAAQSNDSGASVRFVVTWSHPELRPALWTRALGAPMPAEDNLPLYGVAQALLPASPAPVVELRLDPEDAARAQRLGAKAVLTAIRGEGTADERIARLDVAFGELGGPAISRVAVRFEDGALKLEAP